MTRAASASGWPRSTSPGASSIPTPTKGRAELIASLNEGVGTCTPAAAGLRDPAQCAARDPGVPVEIQDGASNGYYNRAALDGSRPAIYFINLKDVGDWPKYSLPTLTYHEGVPGHHLQISLAQESKDIPTSARSASSAPIAKAGRSMPSSSPTSSAL
jgi:uncharacterized protein (DUF885 family)